MSIRLNLRVLQVLGQVTPGKHFSAAQNPVSQNETLNLSKIRNQTTRNEILTIRDLQQRSKLFKEGGANGGGGDEVGLQFYAAFESAVARYKKNDPQAFGKFEKQMIAAATTARFVVVEIDFEAKFESHEVFSRPGCHKVG